MQTHVEYRVQTFENPIHYSILAPPAWILYKHQTQPADVNEIRQILNIRES
jgi:hypothetical protein